MRMGLWEAWRSPMKILEIAVLLMMPKN